MFGGEAEITVTGTLNLFTQIMFTMMRSMAKSYLIAGVVITLMMMVLIGSENMRDVVAFPKTQRGQDLLLEAPSTVSPEQLEELSIRVTAPPVEAP